MVKMCCSHAWLLYNSAEYRALARKRIGSIIRHGRGIRALLVRRPLIVKRLGSRKWRSLPWQRAADARAVPSCAQVTRGVLWWASTSSAEPSSEHRAGMPLKKGQCWFLCQSCTADNPAAGAEHLGRPNPDLLGIFHPRASTDSNLATPNFTHCLYRYQLPKRLVAHMAVNQAVDACVGVVPFLGDLFDFGCASG
jgi:hypothetical protein